HQALADVATLRFINDGRDSAYWGTAVVKFAHLLRLLTAAITHHVVFAFRRISAAGRTGHAHWGRSVAIDRIPVAATNSPSYVSRPSEVRLVRLRHVGVLSRVPQDVFGASLLRPVGGA